MTDTERAELDRLRRIERLAFAWKRAYVAYYEAKGNLPVEQYRQAAEALHDAELALSVELTEQEDDGHGRESA